MTEKSADKTVRGLLDRARESGAEVVWDRLGAQSPQCGFGQLGVC